MTLLFSGCGLGDVGPNLDAWRASQADTDIAAPADGTDTPDDADVADADEIASDATPDAAVDATVDAESDAADTATDADVSVDVPECVTDTDCDDGDPCTKITACVDGACASAQPVDCGDGNPCTQDGCVALSGECTHTQLTGPCDDGNSCTIEDTCTPLGCAGHPASFAYDPGQVKGALHSVVALSDGGAAGAGAAGTYPDWTPVVVRVDAQGNQTWQWTGSSGGVADLVTTLDGDLLAVGTKVTKGKISGMVVRLTSKGDAVGDPVEFAGGASRSLTAAALLPGGQLLVAGEAQDVAYGPTQAWIMRLDSSFKVVWERLLPTERVSVIDLALSPASGFALAGHRVMPDGAVVPWGARLDSTGLVAFELQVPELAGAQLRAVRVMPDGGLLVTGVTPLASDFGQVRVARLDASGKLLWHKEIGLSGLQSIESIVALPDDRWLGVGYAPGPSAEKPVQPSLWWFGDDGALLGTRTWDLTAALAAGAASGPDGFVFAGMRAADGDLESAVPALYRTDAWGVLKCQASDPCTGKSTSGCTDGNPCTHDYCASGQGCKWQVRTAACETTGACPAPGNCAAGVCESSGDACDDGDPCTADACDNAAGCTHVAAEGSCEDGNPCTSEELCSDGKCVDGVPTPCDDSNTCTLDLCNGVSGCQHLPVETGLACGETGVCVAGGCIAPWATHIQAGKAFTCALDTWGTVRCWGEPGALPLGSSTVGPVPKMVEKLLKSVGFTVGRSHGCSMATDASVQCWGGNADGQVGGPSSPVVTEAIKVVLPKVAELAAGNAHTCARLQDATVRCWGSDAAGQLGNGAAGGGPVPSPVVDLSGVTALAAGGDQTCALDGEGKVWCWGRLASTAGGGTEKLSAIPKVVAIPGKAVRVAVGGSFACAVLETTGALACWGDNGHGQMSNGNTKPVEGIQVLPVLTQVQHVSLGDEHGCAVKADGTLWCWGPNESAQLGLGHLNPVNVPEFTLSGARGVAAGISHTCSLRKDGAVVCWGADLGTSAPVKPVPTLVEGTAPAGP
jgi:alpha-tubulin suppressor-like RCC1 family protein